ncbi:MAG: prefoldin subunit [Candidatus Woesearchaeota archaeon]
MSDLNLKINNLSALEQNLQHLISKKKTFQNELLEVESALSSLSDSSFKIIGNFMFKKDSGVIKKELEEKMGLLNVRIKSFEREEADLESKFKNLQDEVLQNLSKKK